MGRELRMVPKNWEHPKDKSGKFIELKGGIFYGSYTDSLEDWTKGKEEWNEENKNSKN